MALVGGGPERGLAGFAFLHPAGVPAPEPSGHPGIIDPASGSFDHEEPLCWRTTMKAVIAALTLAACLNAGIAQAHEGRHHRHQVCTMHHHHRVCHWR